ncbi:MAG: hypothetical protein ACI8W7_001044 [Gammaproteobacteria bacterium]|jgi:hypothetical protein
MRFKDRARQHGVLLPVAVVLRLNNFDADLVCRTQRSRKRTSVPRSPNSKVTFMRRLW